MRSRKHRRPSGRAPDVDADVDLFFGRGRRQRASGPSDRKIQQVCREVLRVLSQAIPGELDDPLLQDVAVVEVAPAPDLSRLAVRLSLAGPVDAAALLARLERARGWLRGEVAFALQRKRTPELFFEVLPCTT